MGRINDEFIKKFARTNVRPGRNTNGALPGGNTGLNVAEIRKFVNELPRCLGVQFTTLPGTNNVQNINFPGDSRLFLGIIFSNFAITDTFTLTINNNLIIQNGSVVLHSMNNSQSINSAYYEYPQPLSGKDTIEVSYTSIAGGIAQQLDFHYI